MGKSRTENLVESQMAWIQAGHWKAVPLCIKLNLIISYNLGSSCSGLQIRICNKTIRIHTRKRHRSGKVRKESRIIPDDLGDGSGPASARQSLEALSKKKSRKQSNLSCLENHTENTTLEDLCAGTDLYTILNNYCPYSFLLLFQGSKIA